MQPCHTHAPSQRRICYRSNGPGVLRCTGAWHRHWWRRTDPTASTSSTSLCSSGRRRYPQRNVEDWCHRTVEFAMVISGVYGQKERRQLQILRWLPPDELSNHQRRLPSAGRERRLRQSMRRLVLRHDWLIVRILAARHDTTCTRKICILHQTRTLISSPGCPLACPTHQLHSVG